MPCASTCSRASRTCSLSLLDGVDDRLGRASGEPQRRVTERGAEFGTPPRIRRRGERAEQRAIVVRVSAAAMADAMRQRCLAQRGEGVGVVLAKTNPPTDEDALSPARIVRALARDRHVVHVAFAEACARDAHEFRAAVKFAEILGAHITHGGAQAPAS